VSEFVLAKVCNCVDLERSGGGRSRRRSSVEDWDLREITGEPGLWILRSLWTWTSLWIRTSTLYLNGSC